jgi:hypothetical protein
LICTCSIRKIRGGRCASIRWLTLTAWGDSSRGGSAPSGSGYTKIYSTENAFVAIKTDGSITAWGQNYGGTGAAPSTGAYTKIYSTAYAFAALKADGSITAWGKPSDGGTTPAPNLANTRLESPHAVIDPSALMTAKADAVE